MSMAQPKKRIKYSLDPNALGWANSDDKFGKRLMEKMGWEKGKGLGANETGITENIKVKYKSDTKGVGFDNSEYENVWLDHQDDFESLLSNLQTNNNNNNSNDKKKATTNGVQSLETQSKEAKGRLHYQKFSRSKDLTNATSHDLDCVLGRAKRTKIKQKEEQEKEEEQERSKAKRMMTSLKTSDGSDVDEERPSFGGLGFKTDNNSPVQKSTSPERSNKLFKTNTMSVSDYFAQKMASKLGKGAPVRQQAEEIKQEEEPEQEEDEDEDEDESQKKKKKKSKKKKRNREVEEEIEDEPEPEPEPEEKKSKKNKKSKKSKKSKRSSSENEEEEEEEHTKKEKTEPEEKSVVEANNNSSGETDNVFGFPGSNLNEMNGYSAYNIDGGIESVQKKRKLKAQQKKLAAEKNLEKDPNFYENRKKKSC